MSALRQLDASAADETTSGASLGGLFAQAARLHPNRTALVVDGIALSYQELAATAARIGMTIQATRPATAPRVTGILASRTVSAYTGLLGALLAGDAYVPLNPRFPRDRLLAILDASQATIVVVDGRGTAVARELAEQVSRPLVFVLPDLTTPPDWAAHI